MLNPAWKIAAVALAATTLAACGTRKVEREVIREQPIVQQVPAPAPAVVERVTVVQPPAAIVEQPTPAPAASGYSWVAGHHVYDGASWQWVPGRWVPGTVRPLPPPMAETTPSAVLDPGSRWVPGYWKMESGDWVWVKGHWVR